MLFRLLISCLFALPLHAELLVYYDFEGTAGTVVPNLVAGATVQGRLDGALEPDLVRGAQGGASPGAALWFDGVDDFVDLDIRAGDLGMLDGDFAVTAWVLIGEETAVVPVVGQGRDIVFDFGFRDLAPRFRTSAGSVDPVPGVLAEPFTWIHCAWVHHGGLMSIYWDGVRVSQVVQGGDHNNNVCPHIGEISGMFFFEGAVDEFAVFDEAISENQIQFLAEGGRADALPAAAPKLVTAPFGPGGTWNLYATLGVEPGQGIPDSWAAQLVAARLPNPLATSETRLGHLAWVESGEELGFLRQLAAGFEGFWIGLSDNENYGGTEGSFAWVGDATNPSPPALSFTRWRAGQPDNRVRGDNNGQDAGQVNGLGTWADFNLGTASEPTVRRKPAIIEWEVGSMTPIPGAEVYSPLPPVIPSAETVAPVWALRSATNSDPVVTLENAVATLLQNRDLAVDTTIPVPDITVLTANTAVFLRGWIEVSVPGIFDFNVTANARFALRAGGGVASEQDVSLALDKGRHLVEVASVSAAGNLELDLVISSADGGIHQLVAGRPAADPQGVVLDLGEDALLWQGVAGERYQIEASEDLSSFLDDGFPVIGTLDALSLPVDVAAPRRFFRLEY